MESNLLDIGLLGDAVVLGALISPYEPLPWLIRICYVIAKILLFLGVLPEKKKKEKKKQF